MKKIVLFFALVLLPVLVFGAGTGPVGFKGNSIIYNKVVLTLPTATTADTIVSRNSTDTLTNKTLTSPIFTSPVLGAATATSLDVVDATASRVSVSGLLKPSSAGGINIGTIALPFSGAYIGSAGDKNTRVTGTFTGQRTTTIPDANVTLNGLGAIDCRKDTTCMSVAIATNGKLVMGSTALSSGSAIVTGFDPAFTNTVSYSCSLGVRGTARNQVDWEPTSASSITITSASGSDTSVIDYICVGH